MQTTSSTHYTGSATVSLDQNAGAGPHDPSCGAVLVRWCHVGAPHGLPAVAPNVKERHVDVGLEIDIDVNVDVEVDVDVDVDVDIDVDDVDVVVDVDIMLMSTSTYICTGYPFDWTSTRRRC